MVDKEFYLVRFGGREVIAIPNESYKVIQGAIARFPRGTWRREMVRLYLKFLNASRLLSLCFRPINTIDIDKYINITRFARWLELIKEGLQEDVIHTVLIWPPQQERGRVYVHILNDHAELIAFAKISTNENSWYLLKNELLTLYTLGEKKMASCHMSKVLISGEWEDHFYLVVKPLPQEATLVDGPMGALLSSCIQEYAGTLREISLQRLYKTRWWYDYLSQVSEIQLFHNEIQLIQRDYISVCRMHGDLGGENIFRSGKKIWLIDWERSSSIAPKLTDVIGYWLGQKHRILMRKPNETWLEFERVFLDKGTVVQRYDVMFALAFLHGAKFWPASDLIKIWQLNSVRRSEI